MTAESKEAKQGSEIDGLLNNLAQMPLESPLKESAEQFVKEISRIIKAPSFPKDAAEKRNITELIQNVTAFMSEGDYRTTLRKINQLTSAVAPLREYVRTLEPILQNIENELIQAAQSAFPDRYPGFSKHMSLAQKVHYTGLLNVYAHFNQVAIPNSPQDLLIKNLIASFFPREIATLEATSLEIKGQENKKVHRPTLDLFPNFNFYTHSYKFQQLN